MPYVHMYSRSGYTFACNFYPGANPFKALLHLLTCAGRITMIDITTSRAAARWAVYGSSLLREG
jgi:hypothetical protein